DPIAPWSRRWSELPSASSAIGPLSRIGTTAAAIGVALVIVLQLIAGPVGSHMIGRAIHHSHGPDDPAPYTDEPSR
ncbi:MAG: monovalent cation/H(+) antiporter subunit G, partial [Ilumatobacteraceae bacterium]